MNKEETYPWIGAVIGGSSGLAISIIFHSVYLNIFLYFVLVGAFVGMLIGMYVNMIKGDEKLIFINLAVGVIINLLCFTGCFIDGMFEKPMAFPEDTFLLLLPIFIGVAGLAMGAPWGGVGSTFIIASSIPIFLLGAFTYHYTYSFTASFAYYYSYHSVVTDFPIFKVPIFTAITFIPAFAFGGYKIGKTIGEIIAKKEEYEQKISEYKAKVEQWKREEVDEREQERRLYQQKISEYKAKYEQLKEEGFEPDEELEELLK